MSTLENLISNYYRIRNNKMDIEKYNKLLLIYDGIKSNNNKFINPEIWYNIYVYNKNVIPEASPNKIGILNQIKRELDINYLDLIYNYYNFLDNCSNVKEISKNVIKELRFILFALSKQRNINFKVDVNVWSQIRQRCLVNKNKTKMPREPITLSEVIHNINNIISIN